MIDKLLYSYIENNLTSGVYYEVDIVAMNDQGEVGLIWYIDFNNSERSLVRHYHELLRQNYIATSICHPYRIDFIENN